MISVAGAPDDGRPKDETQKAGIAAECDSAAGELATLSPAISALQAALDRLADGAGAAGRQLRSGA